MDSLERLIAIFEKFPGIGPRQAQRFVQFLLRSSPAIRRELSDAILSLGKSVHQCPECMRWHASDEKICTICGDRQRDSSYLAIVASDADLAALEKSGTYHGYYFVLGGTISLASEKTSGLRLRELQNSVADRITKGLTEIILAFPANPEGDATAARVRDDVVTKLPDVKISELGRGLSTGSELEYADADTIKSALESRR